MADGGTKDLPGATVPAPGPVAQAGKLHRELPCQDLGWRRPHSLQNAEEHQGLQVPGQATTDRRANRNGQTSDVERAMSQQTTKPAHGWHRDRAGNLETSHHPVDARHIGAHGTHNVRQGNRHGEHTERQRDLSGQNGQE